MSRFTKLVLTLTAGAVLTGCASNSAVQEARTQQKVQGIHHAAQNKQEAIQQQRNQEYLSAMPDWTMLPKAPDSTGLYAIGIGESDNLQSSIRIATLQAEYQLAANFAQEFSGQERSFRKDDDSGSSAGQYTAIIDKVVDSVPMTGFVVTNREVMTIQGKFTAFVELQLPYDAFNVALKAERNLETDREIKARFDELEQRLRERQTTAVQ